MVDKSFSFYKKNVFDFEKTKAKVMDLRRDPMSRLKHLKIISEKCSAQEVEEFYKKHHSFIHQTLQSCIKSVDSQLKPNITTSKQREENELFIHAIESLLCYIPHLIHEKWQYHDLRMFIERLLRMDFLSSNFNEGLRLYIMWYSILMDNAEADVHNIFMKFFVNPTVQKNYNVDMNMLNALVFHQLLKFIVNQIGNILWKEHINSHNFLLKNLQKYYLLKVFPSFQEFDYLFFKHEKFISVQEIGLSKLQPLQYVFINWFLAIIGSDQREFSICRDKFSILDEESFPDVNVENLIKRSLSPRRSETESPTTPNAKLQSSEKSLSHALERKNVTFNMAANYRFKFTTGDKHMMQQALFSNKDSFNMVFGIFHQVFINSLCDGNLTKQVFFILKSWIKGQSKPRFIEDFDSTSLPQKLDNDKVAKQTCQSLEQSSCKISSQKLVQIFISQSSLVFACNWKNFDIQNSNVEKIIEDHIYLCNQSLSLYRYVIMHTSMDADSWMCMLSTLIELTANLVAVDVKFIGELKIRLVETMFVAFVRAFLACQVKKDVWNLMVRTVTSLTHNPVVIQQWAVVVAELTKVLGFVLYKIDLIGAADEKYNRGGRLKSYQIKESHSRSENESQVKTIKDGFQKKVSKPVIPPLLVSKPSTDGDDGSKSIESVSTEATYDSCYSTVSENSPPAIFTPVLDSPFEGFETSTIREKERTRLRRSLSSGSFENFLLSSGSQENLRKVQFASSEQNEITAPEENSEDRSFKEDVDELKDQCPERDLTTEVWLKMLEIFGNVTNSLDTFNHSSIVRSLKPIHDSILKIFMHENYVEDGRFPVMILVPYLLQAVCLPENFLQSKLSAHSMLHDYLVNIPSNSIYLSRLLYALHMGLVSDSAEMSRLILQQYSSQILTLPHQSGIILIEDFIKVALNIISNTADVDRNQIPTRVEALRLLSSSTSILNCYTNLKVLSSETCDVHLKSIDSSKSKNDVVSSLLTSIRLNQKNFGSCCINICGLGIFLCEELTSGSKHPLIGVVINSLLSIHKMNSHHAEAEKTVSIQILSVIREYSSILLNDFTENLTNLLTHFLNYLDAKVGNANFFKEIKIIRSIMYCILEWFLVLPTYFLLQETDGTDLLTTFFRILDKTNSYIHSMYGSGDLEEHSHHPALFINMIYHHLINHFGTTIESNDIISLNTHKNQQMVCHGVGLLDVSYFEENEHHSLASKLFDTVGSPSCKVTIRNLTGKWHWLLEYLGSSEPCEMFTNEIKFSKTETETVECLNKEEVLIQREEVEDKTDSLSEVLDIISDISPECCPYQVPQKLTHEFPCLKLLHCEKTVIDAILEQEFEINTCTNIFEEEPDRCERVLKNCEDVAFKSSAFAKFGLSLGLFQTRSRNQIDFLKNDDKLLREIKHIDNQRCQETQKIAVFYIGPDQHKRTEILLNRKGSIEFEEFYKNLGVMVCLKDHQGFLGGLSQSGSSGNETPFYSSSSLLQVIFHVSTLLVSSYSELSNEEICVTKMRHLGNDEVHIIWSDNKNTYTTDVIPTSFGEVTIVIYPLLNGLFRIQMIKKISLDSFGPLFDGAIISRSNLTHLVRMTAINAGRAIRRTRSHYQNFYEERCSGLEKIANAYRKEETYEDFLFSIVMPGSQFSPSRSYLNSNVDSQRETLNEDSPHLPEKKSKTPIYVKRQRNEFVTPIRHKTEKRNK